MKNGYTVYLHFLIIFIVSVFSGSAAEERDQGFSWQMMKYIDQIKVKPGMFYNPRLIKLIYITDSEIVEAKWKSRDNIEQLLNSIGSAHNHGLRPGDYHTLEINSIIARNNPPEMMSIIDSVRLELLLTDSFLLLSAHMAAGKIDQDIMAPRWTASGIMPDQDWKLFLEISLEDSQVFENIDHLAPKHSMYVKLKEGLKKYRNNEITSVDEEILMIKTNLDRWRALGHPGDHFIMVNIPGFELNVTRNGSTMITSRVIVGQPENQTPAFSSYLTEVEFNPYWIIPPGMLNREIIPAIAEDVEYLEDNNMEVLDEDWEPVDPGEIDWDEWTDNRSGDDDDFPYIIRQRPGLENEMGTIKFLLPNPWYVVIHDTPHRHLFEHANRAYSSGCIRIEMHLMLAEYVLEEHTMAEVLDFVYSQEFMQAEIQNSLPVHIVYITTWTDDDGELQFLQDIYDLDGPMINTLKQFPAWQDRWFSLKHTQSD